MKTLATLTLLTLGAPCSAEETAAPEPQPVKLASKVTLPATDPDKGGKFLPHLPGGQQWKLVWSDEFDGTKIDANKWNILGDHKRKDGWWLKEDVRLDGNGALEIQVKKKDDRFTTGAVNTKGKFTQRFGFFVARCRFTHARGHGPAFWLQSPGVGTVGNAGRDGTEIDIMEKFKDDDRVQHALHWDGYGEHQSSSSRQVTVPGISQGWHTFAVHWTPDEYVFYIDGQESWRTRDGGVSQVPAYVILSDEVRAWNGDLGKQQLPSVFLVDYVRVFSTVED